jgi:tetratricopeptide (TPR) repeat protein
MRRRSRESPQDIVAETQRLMRDPSADGKQARLALTERAVATFPEHPLIRLEYASAVSHFDKELAAAEALRAVSLDPLPEAMLLTRAAMLLVSLGEFAATRSCIDRAARTEPTNAVIVNQLCALRRELALAEEDYASWERLLRVAHQADPSNEECAIQLAGAINVNSHGARLAEALAVIEQTLRVAPSGDSRSAEWRAELEQRRSEFKAVLDSMGGG